MSVKRSLKHPLRWLGIVVGLAFIGFGLLAAFGFVRISTLNIGSFIFCGSFFCFYGITGYSNLSAFLRRKSLEKST